MPFSYANPTSGPSAGGIGWFNFNQLSMSPGDTVTGLTGTLNDGTKVTFDLTATNVSGVPRNFDATPVPTYVGAQFGITGYTGLAGNVAMQTQFAFTPGSNRLTMSNIVVLDSMGNPVPNYTVVVADAESTGLNENWIWNTNGDPWQLLVKLGNQPSPVLTGLGTQTATLAGIDSAILEAAYVLTTQNPTQLLLTNDTNTTAGGREGISVGFATTRVKLEKYIGARLDPTDQFQLDISGSPSDQATTSGAGTGLQTQTSEVFAIPGNTYVVNESMAPGSSSVLTDYTRIVSASNTTPAGSLPSIGNFPINFTPILGDNVTYTVLNAIPQTFVKTVDKAYADIGDILTYTVVIDNPNDFPVNQVQFSDPVPVGTTYIGNLIVDGAYTGTDPQSGLVITTIPANGKVTISWQVKVNTTPPVPTPVVNLGDVIVPGGNSGMTNVVTTQIRTAYVTINKLVDKAYAKPGDVLTYTLVLNNAGNAVANNVVITDAVPTGATFIPGTLTGATGTLPTLTLNAPIAAGGTATVTYQVKVGAVVPNPNPIPNHASATFTYTVDPAKVNGKTGSVQSNTVTTQVNAAYLKIVKSVDKIISYVGDTITYQIAVTNTGNVPASGVVITDLLTAGTSYVPGSLVVSVPSSGDPLTAITLTNPISPGQTVTISFMTKVTAIPNPNPILNKATTTYTYTSNPQNPNGEQGSTSSNVVKTLVFRNHFGQQINDLLHSVALEQTGLAAIANAEGAKIQRMVATKDVTTEQLLCLNQSVEDMLDSLTILESVLKQKLGIIGCQMGNDCRM